MLAVFASMGTLIIHCDVTCTYEACIALRMSITAGARHARMANDRLRVAGSRLDNVGAVFGERVL